MFKFTLKNAFWQTLRANISNRDIGRQYRLFAELPLTPGVANGCPLARCRSFDFELKILLSLLVERQYKYMAYFFLAFIFFVALGFYFPYFSLFPEFKAVTSVIHIHAITLLLWVVVLIVQPFLIAYKKFRAHRIIGRSTYLLMPLIIISSIGVLRQQYNEGIEQHMTSSASLKALFTSITGLLSIVLFYVLAVFSILRQNVAFHMRYMICLALNFIPPSLGRTLGYWLYMTQYHTYNISILICITILISLIIYDKQKKLNYKPYVIGLLIFSIFHISWYAIGHPI